VGIWHGIAQVAHQGKGRVGAKVIVSWSTASVWRRIEIKSIAVGIWLRIVPVVRKDMGQAGAMGIANGRAIATSKVGIVLISARCGLVMVALALSARRAVRMRR